MSGKWERKQRRNRVLAVFVTIGFHVGLFAFIGGGVDFADVQSIPQDVKEWWSGEEAPVEEVAEQAHADQAWSTDRRRPASNDRQPESD